MSAVVCGKRSLFEEIHPPNSKRLRCGGGNSPVHLSFSRTGSSTESLQTVGDPIFQLKTLFPDMDDKLIETILEENGHNIDSAIKSLKELHLSSTKEGMDPNLVDSSFQASKVGPQPVNIGTDHSETFHQDLPQLSEGSKWVELFVQEMLSASNLDDAKDRAARALDAFEKSLMCHSGLLLETLQKENIVLKEQLQNLARENQILKRAVTIQHERQAEHENCSQEIKQLKQLISQYQEQVRTLEVNNYALTIHLQQAQGGSSMPGRFHPDVF